MRVKGLSPGELYDDGERKINLWSLVRDLADDAQAGSLALAKIAIEMALEEKRDELIGAQRHDPSDKRRDFRNGYYRRKRFLTAIGEIKSLKVPRCRRCSLIGHLREQTRRSRGAVEAEAKVVEMFLAGVSTRNVGELLDGLIGVQISAGQVSKLAHSLDAEVKRFHERPLEDRCKYLLLDGIHLKRRSAPRLFRKMCQARRRVVLTAYGITHGGIKELIGFRLENSENAAGWRRLLLSLERRGLTGRKLELIITDGSQGLIEAVDESFPEARHQRCWFHKMSNVLAKVRVRNRQECLAGLRKIYEAANRAAAEKAYLSWARRWRTEEEAAVRCVEKDLEQLLIFFSFPQAHWKMIRTTNGIERCFREVRRRTRSIG